MIRNDDYFHEQPYRSKAFDMYVQSQRWAVLDIETTGLRSFRDYVILIGLVFPEPDPEGDERMHAVQLFAESPEEEADLLHAADELLQTFDCVITYNGRRFDLPFLKTRAKKNHLTISDPYDLDLYQVIRNYSPLRSVLPSLRQKSIEWYMGLSDSRSDEIDGGESVRLYFRYLDTQDPELRRQILLHNHDDILQLSRLLPILESCDLHRAMFNLGLPANGFTVSEIRASGRGLTATLLSSRPITDAVVFPSSDRPYRLSASSSSRKAELEFIPEHPADGIAVLDTASLMGCTDIRTFENRFPFSRLPGIESGYLIYDHHGHINYLGINGFLLAFIRTLRPLLHPDC
ncbi:MAG: ribonuclease H-like domain-containing protein [Clostridiales bacterium]|jgi:uncharacterized protein YprB with RNaseH-like and TPR domain|nr:ribonuclease H-like domain-containing protein [Clostridiales bacterium]